MNFPPIEDLLPHRDTMLLLDRVVDFEDSRVAAEFAPRADAWYANAQGNMPAWIGIELMAQTVAAHVSLSKRQRGEMPQLGFLLGTRRFEAHASAFPTGQTLRVEAMEMFKDESGLGAYECRVLMGTEILAEATLKVFEPEDVQQFMQMQERGE